MMPPKSHPTKTASQAGPRRKGVESTLRGLSTRHVHIGRPFRAVFEHAADAVEINDDGDTGTLRIARALDLGRVVEDVRAIGGVGGDPRTPLEFEHRRRRRM